MLVVSILESDRRRGHILPIVLQPGAFAWTKYTFFVHDFIFVVLEMSRFILTVNMGDGKGGPAPPNFGTTKKCGFSKCTIKVCVHSVLGPPLLAQHTQTVSSITCSSGSNAQVKSRALERSCVSSKNLLMVRDGDESEREVFFSLSRGKLIIYLLICHNN